MSIDFLIISFNFIKEMIRFTIALLSTAVTNSEILKKTHQEKFFVSPFEKFDKSIHTIVYEGKG